MPIEDDPWPSPAVALGVEFRLSGLVCAAGQIATGMQFARGRHLGCICADTKSNPHLTRQDACAPRPNLVFASPAASNTTASKGPAAVQINTKRRHCAEPRSIRLVQHRRYHGRPPLPPLSRISLVFNTTLDRPTDPLRYR